MSLEVFWGSGSGPAWRVLLALAIEGFVFPMFKTIERAIGKPAAETLDHGLRPLGGVFPELAAWAARIEALPGYDATFPPHWREG